ncbi:MAG: beta-galactosidase [Planctomycetota bacterium]|jgi:beta-galactosidase
MKYRGVDYYAEAWPEERWDQDISMMKKAGINLVKIGVFSWAKLEPKEGCFDLDWFVRLADKISAADLNLFIATPTAAPPAWMTAKYPEVLNFDAQGNRTAHGLRRHYCSASPLYREFCRKIVAQMAAALTGNQNIIAWQIDNEIAFGETGPCCCSQCTERFKAWLKKRYGSLENLNNAWGGAFWSGDYSAWEEINPPYPRAAWQLDYIRFHSFLFKEFINDQVEVIRKYDESSIITTNSWLGLNAPVDPLEIFEPLDVASYDSYINYHGSLQAYRAAFDMYRNIKNPARPFWIAETGAWNCMTAEDYSFEALRAWVYEFFARGAEAVVYFRWRQSVMGEEDHPAILGWSGKPTQQYEKIKEIFCEFDLLKDKIKDLPLPKAEAAVLWEPDTALLQQIKTGSYRDNIILADDLLNQQGILPDILPVREELDLSGYKLLILPQLERVEQFLADKIISFVEDGGVVLAQPRLGLIDKNGKYIPETAPSLLKELFGVEINERWDIRGTEKYGPVQFVPVEQKAEESLVKIKFTSADINAAGHSHMEKLEINQDLNILAEYKTGLLAGTPTVTENSYGKGKAIYQACWLDESGSAKLFDYAADKAGIAKTAKLPENVSAVKRGKLRFYINSSNKKYSFPLVKSGEKITGVIDNDSVQLKPYDVCIVREN